MFSRGTYSARAAGRDLERLSPEERADAEVWYKLTEPRAISLGAPSNLSWVFALRFIEFVLKIPLDSPAGGSCGMTVNMGYAARMTDVERRDDLQPWGEAEIADLVAGDEHGHIDVDAAKDQGERAANLVRWILPRIDDPEFFAIARCTPGVWEGLGSWVVLNIHSNMRQHSARPRDLRPGTVLLVMRLGYVLRCLDEALGEEPGDPTSYAV